MPGVLPRDGVWVLPSNIGWSGVHLRNRGGLELEGGGGQGFFQGTEEVWSFLRNRGGIFGDWSGVLPRNTRVCGIFQGI